MKKMIYKHELMMDIMMLTLGIMGILVNILIWPNIVRMIVFIIISVISTVLLYNTVKEHEES